jgi:hypothetical protein
VANAVQSALRAAGLHQPVEITGGYPPVADPPAPGVLDPDIRVHWAHWGRPHFEWYGKPDYGMRENLDGWLSLPNPFTMVEYYPDGFAGPSIHPPMATALGRDNRWLIDHGVRGNFQLMHSHQQWWNHTLAAWLGIAFYYSERDPLEFLDDYATHYFGPAAAEAMVAYHRIFEVEPWLAYWAQGERWSDPGWANPDETARGVDLLDRLEALLDEAEKATTDPLDSYRLSKLLTVGRAQILLGRARARSTALIHEVDKSRQADGLRAALAFEREVVEPLAAALRDDPRALGSDDMYHKLTKTAPLIEQALAELS